VDTVGGIRGVARLCVAAVTSVPRRRAQRGRWPALPAQLECGFGAAPPCRLPRSLRPLKAGRGSQKVRERPESRVNCRRAFALSNDAMRFSTSSCTRCFCA